VTVPGGGTAPSADHLWAKLLSLESRFSSQIAAGGVPLMARKPGLTARSSTTTTDDPDLQIPLLAGVAYLIGGWIWYDASHNPGDMKIRLYTGTDNNGNYSLLHNEGGATGFNNSGLAYNLGDFISPLSCNGVGVPVTAVFTGYAAPAANTALILQWAVNTASASNTTVHGNSWLTATPIP
jgi:hypothetical protein